MSGFYDVALEVCSKYIQGNTKKFLDRQITGYLNKTPESLQITDKQELGRRCGVAAAPLLGLTKSEELMREILSL